MQAITSKLLSELVKRQQGNDDGGLGNDDFGDDGDDGVDGWWWSSTGLAVRYTIVAVIFALFLLYFVGGYWHGRRRLRKGLAPLAYHRWMVTRRPVLTQMYYNPTPDYRGDPQYYGNAHPQQESYPMYGFYRPAPPAYSGADGPPPVYQPPEGASKIMADQSYFPTQRNQHAPLQTMPGGTAHASSSMAVPDAVTPSDARQ